MPSTMSLSDTSEPSVSVIANGGDVFPTSTPSTPATGASVAGAHAATDKVSAIAASNAGQIFRDTVAISESSLLQRYIWYAGEDLA